MIFTNKNANIKPEPWTQAKTIGHPPAMVEGSGFVVAVR